MICHHTILEGVSLAAICSSPSRYLDPHRSVALSTDPQWLPASVYLIMSKLIIGNLHKIELLAKGAPFQSPNNLGWVILCKWTAGPHPPTQFFPLVGLQIVD